MVERSPGRRCRQSACGTKAAEASSGQLLVRGRRSILLMQEAAGVMEAGTDRGDSGNGRGERRMQGDGPAGETARGGETTAAMETAGIAV